MSKNTNNKANKKLFGIGFVTILLCTVLSASGVAASAIIGASKGFSAYQVAVRNGFTGTEEEWIASLKGDKGETGETGAKGEQGQTGATGATGAQGEKGDKGDTGETGATGAQGEQGLKGDTGATGAQGPQGEKGDKGDTGATGPQGEQGLKGDTGATGAQGPQGEQGLKGDTGAAGADGEKGDKGDTGATGAKGDKGEKGDTGTAGADGKTIEEITAAKLNEKLALVDTEVYLTAYARFNSATILNESLKRLSENYLYSLKDNRFIVVDDAGYVLLGSDSYAVNSLELSNSDLYTFTTSNNISTNYSSYLVGGTATDLVITKGLDVGALTNVESVQYTNTVAAQEVVIRTNSSFTSLTVTAFEHGSVGDLDYSCDTIKHYDYLGSLTIKNGGMSSYHENGVVAFADVTRGNLVLEKDSNVKLVHINAKEESGTKLNEFDEIILTNNNASSLPKIVSRDQVNVTSATKLVTVVTTQTSQTDEIYVYPYTDSELTATGTTEKTTEQNTEVNSTLGKVVLDTNSNSGEKALSNNEKNESANSVINEAKAEEINTKETKTFASSTLVVNLDTMNEYSSLSDAIGEVASNESLALVKDVDVTGWVEINKTFGFTIDLAGNKIQRTNGSIFDIYSKIIFKDSVGNGKVIAKGRALYCNAGADCVIEGGNFIGDDGTVVNVYGDYGTGASKLTMNGGSISAVINENYNYTNNASGAYTPSAMFVDSQSEGAEVVINGGTINSEASCGINFANAKCIDGKCTVTVNGGTFNCKTECFVGNGNTKGSVLTINGGTFVAEEGACAYLPGQDTVNINGGSFTGEVALLIKGGNITITNGTFIAFGEKIEPEEPTSSGGTQTGDAIYIEDNYGTQPKGDGNSASAAFVHEITVTISGGTFTSQNAFALAARFTKSGKTGAVITVSGGTFNSAETLDKYFTSTDFTGSVTGIE